mmetsp:Transcript_39431/g.118407  ORF Transcript_39431/g.118407 Transcript_39431/m.118407 type:complete len:239 (-) Transcript_39431:46-762(-)
MADYLTPKRGVRRKLPGSTPLASLRKALGLKEKHGAGKASTPNTADSARCDPVEKAKWGESSSNLSSFYGGALGRQISLELSSKRMTLENSDAEVGRMLHYLGVKMGKTGRPEDEFEAISALEEALANIQESIGPGDEESAVVAHNLWVLLHNIRARHKELMKQSSSRALWKASTDIDIGTKQALPTNKVSLGGHRYQTNSREDSFIKKKTSDESGNSKKTAAKRALKGFVSELGGFG